MSLALVARKAALLAPWNRNSLWAAARAVPSLDLRFADNKSLVDATTGQNLVSFSRSSGGTYVDSQGVIQKATTNLLLRSEEFQTTWSPLNVTVSSDTSTSPTGSLTADTITPAASTAAHLISQIATVVASTPCTASVYIKNDGAPFVQVACDNGASVGAFVNVNTLTGAVTRGPELAGGATNATGSVVSVGNGWYRVSVGATHSGTIGRILISPLPAASSAASVNPSTTTAATDKVLLWGAQLEQSSTVGEYIPTTSTINSAPRFDHNPTTGESLGLLVEEQRANLTLNSEDFSLWLNIGTMSINSATSPAGTSTADKLIATNGGANGQCTQGLTITSGATVTGSVFVKAGGFDRFELVLLSNNNTTPYCRATINPNTGAITSAASAANGGTNASASVIDYGNGWYRFSVTVTYPAVTAAGWRLNLSNSDASNGDGVKGVFLWGMQFEEGAFPTSYIPTTTATATRSADVASISGSNFSGWYRQDEGTVFVQTLASANANTVYAIASNGTLNQNSFYFDNDSGLMRNVTFSGSSAVSVLSLGAVGTVGLVNKLCGGYKTNDFAAVRNGGTAATDVLGAAPVAPVQLDIGRNPNGVAATYAGTCISRLTYWPQRLANTTLQTITQ